MDNASLVSVGITSNLALSQSLRDDLKSLQTALGQRRQEVEIADVSLGGMGAIDPDTVKFLIEIAQTAAGAVAGMVAKELCSWLWMKLRRLAGVDQPAITLTIGRQAPITIAANATPEQIDATVQLVESAIRATAKARTPA